MARALRRPIWRPSGLSGFKSLVSEIVTKISFTRLAIAVFVLPLILHIYREVTRDALVIDPFSVPRRFEEAGLTAEVSSEAHRTRRAPASIGEFTGNDDRFCPGYRCGSGIVTSRGHC